MIGWWLVNFAAAAIPTPTPAPAPAPRAAAAPDRDDDADRWRATLDRVTRAVVTIRMDRPRAFEGVDRSNSQATGFVVDAEQGLILTNRHVVSAGPVYAEAVFLDNEVVPLEPVYRDPIHDFGLFRFDPAALRFMTTEALPLRPEDAAVGIEIRVVGNDSGERLSIHDGTLARLDRPAPVYGGGYSDFDTFYIQAASATSGGSSGSPVVDVDGDVLALNAGAKTTAATAFYLPLERVARAVALVRAGAPVPRGTLQTRAEYTPYDELRRLGLSDATERAARAVRPTGTGLLVIREVLPDGPADGALRVGDVVVSVDGAPIPDFVTFEGILDDHVGGTVAVAVERAGAPVAVDLTVGDLAALVPSRLVELGGGVLHDLSVHQARTSQVPVRGVYVADPGRSLRAAGLGAGSVIVEANGAPVDDLDALLEVLASVPDREPVRVRSYSLVRPQQVGEGAFRMDRRWFAFRSCARDPHGAWPCAEMPGPSDPAAGPVAIDVGFGPVDDRRGRALQPSLVGVRTDVPYPVAGLSGTVFTGAGVVVDAARGLVVVDRDTVPVALGEFRLVIAGAFEIPARLVALHEVHDLAVLQYDPADLGSVVLTGVTFADRPFARADRPWWVGMEGDGAIRVERAEVAAIEPFGIAPSGPPRFRERSLDVVALRDPLPSTNGVLVDRRGRVGAFWASFSFNDGQQVRSTWRAIPADVVREAVELADGVTGPHPAGVDRLRTLGWELGVLSLPAALARGLPAAEAERLVAHDAERRNVLQIERIAIGDPLEQEVRTGDFLLAIDGAPVSRYREVERALHGHEQVHLLLCRGGGLVEVDVRPRPLVPLDVTRVVSWAGVRVHAPDRSAELEGVTPGRPYVAVLESGSPAGRGRLYSQRSILAVDGVDTPDLDAFVAAIRRAGPSVRLELRTREGEREVVTVEPDPAFFPSEELRWDGDWQRIRVE